MKPMSFTDVIKYFLLMSALLGMLVGVLARHQHCSASSTITYSTVSLRDSHVKFVDDGIDWWAEIVYYVTEYPVDWFNSHTGPGQAPPPPQGPPPPPSTW